MHNKLHYLSIFIVLLLLVAACTKEYPPDIYLMSSEPKEYMRFKTGTWWEYVDTASGDIIYESVVEHDSGFVELEEHNQLIRLDEFFLWTTNNSLYFAMQYSSDSTNTGPSMIINKVPNNSLGYHTSVFFYKFNESFSANPTGLIEVTIYDKYDTMEIFGEKYADVVAFKESHGPYHSRETKVMTYIARHYGIIRIDKYDEDKNDWQVFLLNDSHIIQ